MKRIFSILLIVFIIVGCSQDRDIKTIEEVDITDLQQYKGTMVGNNSAVGSIISELPGGGTYKEIQLSADSIEVIYGLKDGGTITEEEFSNYWLNEDNLKKNFLFNAVSTFILIDNAENVSFEVDAEEYYSFSISRTELEKELSSPLAKYQENGKLWEEEIKNDLVQNEEKRNRLFNEYPIEEK